MKLVLAAAILSIAAAPRPPRVFDPHQVEDLEAAARELSKHVAELHVAIDPAKDDAFADKTREGYGVVLDPTHIAVLSFVVERWKAVEVRGPTGKAMPARVVMDDIERRVAILETKEPLSRVDLVPAKISPRSARVEDATVFALVSTGEEAAVVHGVITQVGEEEEYGGHHRVDLKLVLGMPVFDDQARFVGYSRAVAWDRDQMMLVTPEQIVEARTATGAADRERLHPTPKKKAWWSK